MSLYRVLMVTDNMEVQGISTVIINYYKYINLQKFRVDIFTGKPVNSNYRKELNSDLTTVYIVGNRKSDPLQYYKELNKVLQKEKYDIIHVHGNSSTMGIELMIAKHNKVPVRIAHCHNSRCGSMARHRLLLPLFRLSYTQGIACSSLAGNWIFGENNFIVIRNGFAVKSFIFNSDSRNHYRQMLGLEDFIVIGHVGVFNEQKNQEFLIKVVKQLGNIKPDIKLLLVGKGPEMEEIRVQTEREKISEKVLLYGESNDISGLLSAMDIFAFPSKWEGLGISLVEAQINGLTCFASTSIPKEAAIGNNIEFIPVGDNNIENWTKKILEKIGKGLNRNTYFEDNRDSINLYDIGINIRCLEELYLKCLQQNVT